MQRRDGSVRSANTPFQLSADTVESDFNTYRCMVIAVYFTDDQKNLTFQNQQVTYDCLILGGRKEGQIIANAKMVNYLGGQFNYHERVLRKSEAPFNGPGAVDPSKQKGDIVYIQFVGKTSNPIIIGLGTHMLDLNTTGATKDDGAVWREEFNGVHKTIDKNGNYEFIRKGGILNTEAGYFAPADRITEDGGEAPEELFQARLKFSDNVMLWEDPKSSIEFKKEETLYTHIVGKEESVYTEIIDGIAEKTTRSYKSGLTIEENGGEDKVTITTSGGTIISIDGASGAIEITDSGTGKLKISNSKVALGSAAAELLDLFDQTLTAIQALTHIGNLGVPTSPPLNLATFTLIQTLLQSIKGTL